jgi:hypothetical protein
MLSLRLFQQPCREAFSKNLIFKIYFMQVAVFDTYVTKKDGQIMHFDIVVPTGTDESKVFEFGKTYLKKKNQDGQAISSRECQFCHIEHLQAYMEKDIQKQGYYILEMQGC